MATLVENKKARLKYAILETFEAGIELFGFEVKSLRGKRGSLAGAHVSVRGNEAYLLGAHIPPYQPENTPKDYDPYRARRLLLHKSEVHTLIGREAQKGLTVVPLSVYTRGRNLKVAVAIVRGKKQHDKRETIKRRDTERDIERSLKKHFSI